MSQTWDIDLMVPASTSPSTDIQRIIDGFSALRSCFSGASEPTGADRVAYMFWADTITGLLKQRNAADSAWVTIGTMASANLGLLSLAGGNLTGGVNNVKTTVASATTPDIFATTVGGLVDFTGNHHLHRVCCGAASRSQADAVMRIVGTIHGWSQSAHRWGEQRANLYGHGGGAHDSELQGWTFGNIIIGGLIGFVIDAASGAMGKDPSVVTVVLTPRAFASAEDRDRYFDTRRERVLREASDAEARLKWSCQPETCASQLKALDAARDSELAQIGVRRGQAKIDERVAPGLPPPPEPGRKLTLDDLPLPAVGPAARQ